jgi:hypothetical protein
MNNTTTNETTATPLSMAEKLFADCVLISVKEQDEQKRKEKFVKAKLVALKALNTQIEYYMKARAEFENICKVSDKNT